MFRPSIKPPISSPVRPSQHPAPRSQTPHRNNPGRQQQGPPTQSNGWRHPLTRQGANGQQTHSPPGRGNGWQQPSTPQRNGGQQTHIPQRGTWRHPSHIPQKSQGWRHASPPQSKQPTHRRPQSEENDDTPIPGYHPSKKKPASNDKNLYQVQTPFALMQNGGHLAPQQPSGKPPGRPTDITTHGNRAEILNSLGAPPSFDYGDRSPQEILENAKSILGSENANTSVKTFYDRRNSAAYIIHNEKIVTQIKGVSGITSNFSAETGYNIRIELPGGIRETITISNEKKPEITRTIKTTTPKIIRSDDGRDEVSTIDAGTILGFTSFNRQTGELTIGTGLGEKGSSLNTVQLNPGEFRDTNWDTTARTIERSFLDVTRFLTSPGSYFASNKTAAGLSTLTNVHLTVGLVRGVAKTVEAISGAISNQILPAGSNTQVSLWGPAGPGDPGLAIYAGAASATLVKTFSDIALALNAPPAVKTFFDAATPLVGAVVGAVTAYQTKVATDIVPAAVMGAVDFGVRALLSSHFNNGLLPNQKSTVQQLSDNGRIQNEMDELRHKTIKVGLPTRAASAIATLALAAYYGTPQLDDSGNPIMDAEGAAITRAFSSAELAMMFGSALVLHSSLELLDAGLAAAGIYGVTSSNVDSAHESPQERMNTLAQRAWDQVKDMGNQVSRAWDIFKQWVTKHGATAPRLPPKPALPV